MPKKTRKPESSLRLLVLVHNTQSNFYKFPFTFPYFLNFLLRWKHIVEIKKGLKKNHERHGFQKFRKT